MFASITQVTAMKTNTGKKAVNCPVEQTLEIIGGRWKVLVIHELLQGTRRFNELERALVGVSHRILTQQLRELEQFGVVRREVFGEIPPKVEYSLTPLGTTLRPVLMSMHEWAVDHAAEIGAIPRINAKADVGVK